MSGSLELGLESMMQHLEAMGTKHGDWKLCFDQLVEQTHSTLLALEEERVQLIATLDAEKSNSQVQVNLRHLAQQRVMHLEGLLMQRDLQLQELQKAGGVVLSEVLRLRSRYESQQQSETGRTIEGESTAREYHAQS